MSRPRLLIIAGSSGVGKSTISARAASSLGFSKSASTDTIREALRTQFDAEQVPALHRSSFESAGNGAIEDWHATVAVLSEAIQAVVSRAASKHSDLILEGVHIIPSSGILEGWRESGGVASGVLLYVEDEDAHRQFIRTREKHNDRGLGHYLDNLDRIRAIQEEMLAKADESGWFVLDASIGDPIGQIGDSFEN
jgi:2-phosphoglycerate kinase